MRGLHDGGGDGLGMLVRDDHVDPDLDEQHGLLACPVRRLQVPVLLAEATDLGHRQAAAPSPVTASITSSSLSGWMIAVINLMGCRLLAHGSPVEDHGARCREHLAGYPVMMPAQEQFRDVIPAW